MPARFLNLTLGLWLFISAFCWPHAGASGPVTWISGLLIALVALVSMAFPPARWLNAVLGVWVVAAAFVFQQDNATLWHNLILGMSVFFIAPVHPVRDEIPPHLPQHA